LSCATSATSDADNRFEASLSVAPSSNSASSSTVSTSQALGQRFVGAAGLTSAARGVREDGTKEESPRSMAADCFERLVSTIVKQ
jgi:hypothetical protein